MNNNKQLFEGMVLFHTVVQQNGFGAAAKALGHTAGHVSKEISRLETRLGVRLLNRTTRKISLTEPGKIYLENARRVIEDTKLAEARLLAQGDKPYGELRMSVPVIFAHNCLNLWLPEFFHTYPDIRLDLDISERRADLVAEGFDLLVRIGELQNSDFIARELFKTDRLTVASPNYLARYGNPRHPDELAGHRLIDFSLGQVLSTWRFLSPDGNTISVPASTFVRCNDALTERMLAESGCGIARLPALSCQQQLDSGELVAILGEFNVSPSPVHVIYASRSNLPAKIRVMIDFLAEKCKDFGRNS